MYKIRYGGALTDSLEEKAIIKSIKKSRKTRNWQQAEEGALFEKELSSYIGVKHAILTNSGSSAGLLAMSALELPKGSEVIISAVTFPTIFNIILQCGLVPVVVDAVAPHYGFDIEDVAAAITPRTRAIIAIHPVGNPVDMPALMKLVKKQKNKIYVVEDNCDGLGSTIQGKKVGSFGDVSITSLHAAHIVSMGVGGVVFTSNPAIAKNVRIYRDWGRQANTGGPNKYKELPKDYNPRFIYEKIGYNLQVLELQAAMGRVQLKKLPKTKELRTKNFEYLKKHLSQFEHLVMPESIPGADVCWFSFPLSTLGDRGKLVSYLEKKGIETRSLFSGNICLHPAYRKEKFIDETGTETEYILKQSFWISCHPALSKKDLKYIVKTFSDYYKTKTK